MGIKISYGISKGKGMDESAILGNNSSEMENCTRRDHFNHHDLPSLSPSSHYLTYFKVDPNFNAFSSEPVPFHVNPCNFK